MSEDQIKEFYKDKVDQLNMTSRDLAGQAKEGSLAVLAMEGLANENQDGFNRGSTEEESELDIIKRNLKNEPNLEILVDLAKQGDIDPWDLNLESITSVYLKAIKNNPGETLREAGKAIFYASVLLRMKSDILMSQSSDALNIGIHRELDDDAMLEDELARRQNKQITFDDLEAALRRRFIQKAKRFRKVTLLDLIAALQEARDEEETREYRKQQKFLDLDGYHIVEPELGDDLLDLVHAEDLEGCIEQLELILPRKLQTQNGMEFKELVEIVGNWSNAFLAIIFLAHDAKIELKQEEFYGDLWIYEPQS